MVKKTYIYKEISISNKKYFFYYLKFPLGAQVLFESQIRGNDHLSHCLTKWHQQISSHCEYSLLEEQPLSPRSVQVFAWKDLPRMRKFQLLLVEVAEVPFRPWYLKLLKNFVKSKFKMLQIFSEIKIYPIRTPITSLCSRSTISFVIRHLHSQFSLATIFTNQCAFRTKGFL